MASLFQSGKHGVINTSDTTTNGLYVIKLISEAYTLQNNITIDRNIIYAGVCCQGSTSLLHARKL